MSDASLLKYRVLEVIERAPHIYRAAMVFRLRNSAKLRMIVSQEHDLLIEGYPRSANSFAERAFMFANGWRYPRVASHLHSPVQVELAARWGIPTILLVREPRAAIVAWMAYAVRYDKINEERFSQTDKQRWVICQTARYARFYERTNALRGYFVLAPFERVTENFGEVVVQVNKRFGTEFDIFDHTKENMDQIFNRSREYLAPNAEREAHKPEFRAIYDSDINRKWRERAEAAYHNAMHCVTNN